MAKTILTLSVLLILTVTRDGPAQSTDTDFPPGLKSPNTIDTLVCWLSGSFSSAEQARQDSAYRDIRLHMFPIWKERTDGFWLYVEQAVAEYQHHPYRQRVYHLYQANDSTCCSDVYLIPDPLRFIGAWQLENPLAGLSPDSLVLREGCTTFLRYTGMGKWLGGTRGTDCTSDLRGAAYATSQVVIERNLFISWDQGFNATGDQVWGAVGGGYIFRKIQ